MLSVLHTWLASGSHSARHGFYLSDQDGNEAIVGRDMDREFSPVLFRPLPGDGDSIHAGVRSCSSTNYANTKGSVQMNIFK